MSEICNVCGKTHEQKRNYLGIQITNDEANSMELILNRLSCIEQALNVRNIPESESKENVKLYIDSLITIKTETKLLEKFWWNEMIQKYNLTGIVYIDLITKEFYSLG